LDRYTGETDPDEHLKVYITHVALYTSQDAVFCKAFPTTLKGPALEWFTTLPPYSINNLTSFHTCSPPIVLAAVHTKLPQSPSWALDKNKANHSEHS